jgi:Tol biopolymer transport system component
MWRSRLDGSELRALPFPGGTAAFPRWSPDGKTIAFTGHARGSLPNAYTISFEGGKPQQLAPGIDNLGDPDWSADGSQLVVDRELAGAAGKAPASVLGIVGWKDRGFREIEGSNGLEMPRWSPDGRTIAAVTDDRKEVRLYDVAAGKWKTIAEGKSFGNTAWSADSAYLYYQEMMEPGQPVVRIQIANRAVETVVNFQKLIDSGVSSCIFNSLTLDGKVLVAVGRGNADIYGATLALP